VNKGKVLIVDDDERLCRLVSRHLNNSGYSSSWVCNGEGMRRQLQQEPFALIIMDIMLPGEDGVSLVREIRGFSEIPIIFLSAKADITDKVSGLETGADDYVTKPFEQAELLARIQSVLRRSRPAPSRQRKKALARFAGWQLNLVDQTLVSPEGQEVVITNSEFQLLYALISNPDEVITRDKILNVISGREWSPLDRSADMAISKLRKKIEPNPSKPVLIRTVRNRGYQLTSAVEFED
jgi:two-component system, OmpR family, response regulator